MLHELYYILGTIRMQRGSEYADWCKICTITGSNDHYVAVCRACCATDQKLFHIIIHSRPFLFMATVANGAVRISIGLQLI